MVTQRIAEAVKNVYQSQPERAAAFAGRLDAYERWLARLKLADEDIVLFPEKPKLVSQSLAWALVALLGLPLAIYGWLHRLLPFMVVRWAVHRFTEPGKHKAQTSTAALAAGLVAFGICYSVYVAVFYRFFGWPASFWYALSLPVTSLLAHYYLRELRRLVAGVRNTVVLVRAPLAAKRLLALRQSLIAEIEAVREERGKIVAAKS